MAELIRAQLLEQEVFIEDETGRNILREGSYGGEHEHAMQLSLLEATYLLEREKISVYSNEEKLTLTQLISYAKETQAEFWTRYVVFRDLRERGYVVKTALKFGADFRVYDRGIKPGEDHARWVVYPVHESKHLTWHEFSAKNRVAHSTKKRLMMGIVDDEGDVIYYEIRWIRP